MTAPVCRPVRTPVRLGRVQTQCPVCRSLDLEYEFIIDGYPACSCRRCSLLFLNPQPPSDVAISDHSDDPGIYDISAANAASRMALLRRYAALETGRLLLVGADSVMRADAHRLGFDVLSMSMSQLEYGDFPTTAVGTIEAALIACSLETAEDPASALGIVRRLLAPDGALMIIAPTLDSRTARLFRSQWWEFTKRNRYYFSTDTLQCLLARVGFGDPIIMREESIVSLDYMRKKVATLKTLRYRMIKLFVGLSPTFLRNRLFRFLHSRTIVLVRSKTASALTRLSVIVPVYNEKTTFVPLIEQLLEKSIDGVDIEVIVVESNSTDGTREQVLRYEDHPRLRVVLEDRPQGKGHAVRKGLGYATGDVVLIQDADLEYDIGDYDSLLEPILRYEQNFVIGSRHTKQGKLWKMRQFNDAAGLAVFFNIGHVLFLALFNLLYQQRLKDPFSMFKVFRRQCLYGLHFECKRFDFDFELTIKLLRKGYCALELPVNYRARSFSAGKKVSVLRDPWTWLRALVKFRASPLYIGYEDLR